MLTFPTIVAFAQTMTLFPNIGQPEAVLPNVTP